MKESLYTDSRLHFTAREKVMFLHPSVILFTGKYCLGGGLCPYGKERAVHILLERILVYEAFVEFN